MRRREKEVPPVADERCSQAVLDFLTTTEVGKIVPAAEEDEDTGSEASEWELRERMEPEEERREEVEALGAGEEPLFLPTPPFIVGVYVRYYVNS